jgi:hypothetical protein
VGTIALLAVNAFLLDEILHPLEALRAYSQARQTGWAPAALGVRDRMLWLSAFFSVVWATTLAPPAAPRGRGRRWAFVAAAVAACGAAWWALARALPWGALQALAG